ncbi:MAG TPA: hypothetical protein VFD56_03815 [Chitinophagaceae bacterium]|nr:hypothetical protein [Chitinophagaceae bacterium]
MTIEEHFDGEFIVEPEFISDQLKQIKAFIFDWDGVFNTGEKNAEGHSTFNEVDSMGTNLLRLNHYLRNKECPFSAVITGENNKISFLFSEREHFHSVYFNAKNKRIAVEHFCRMYSLQPKEICFVFDDVLDFSVAEIVGIRIMVGRKATSLLREFAVSNNLVDYITASNGGAYAIRETTELLMALSEIYDETIEHRMKFTDKYQTYIKERNSIVTKFYGPEDISVK